MKKRLLEVSCGPKRNIKFTLFFNAQKHGHLWWVSHCEKLLEPHSKEIWNYVFPEKELPGLSPIFHIHVSVADLYIPTLDPPILLQQNRQYQSEDYRNRSQEHECRNWDCAVTAQFLFWEYMFRIFGIVSLQCWPRYRGISSSSTHQDYSFIILYRRTTWLFH